MGKNLVEYPSHWKIVKLGEFVHSEKGKKPKRLCNEPSEECNIPYIDIKAFEKGIIERYTDGENCRLCNEDDILIVWDGSRSGFVGKGKNGALGSTLARLNFLGINNDYAYYFMKSKYLEINSRAKGAATPHVDPELLWNYQFPLPPIEEQQRIVDKIEELFSELDSSIEALKRAKQKLKHYRQSVLKSAFEGKLTKSWREAHKDELEDAEVLLERIKKEREEAYEKSLQEWKGAVKVWEESGKEGKKPTKPKKPKELPPLSEEELENLPELPEGWKWVKLSNISHFIQIGPFGSLLHKSDYIKNAVPVINPSHIKNQKIDPDMNLTINKAKAQKLKKYIMRKNDIVIGRRGEMGRCALILPKDDGFLCGTGSLFVRISVILNHIFYTKFLGSKIVKEFFENNSIGTTMQNLNEKILQSLPIPLFSIKEQELIINKIDSYLSEADIMEKNVNKNLEKVEQLRQSILKQAFTGKLIEYDERINID